MRLAFVHGINNEQNSPEGLRRDVWDWLLEGWDRAKVSAPPKPDLSIAFYAKELADSTNGRVSGAIPLGATEKTANVGLQFLREYQLEANISDAELSAQLSEQGVPQGAKELGKLGRLLVDIAEALERLSPGHGRLVAKEFLKQASHYIENVALAQKIDGIVRKEIFGAAKDPVVVVAHSLGTIVSYRLVAEAAATARNIPLYVTIGSPLGLRMMADVRPARVLFPTPPLTKWVNGVREEDFVTLGREIEKKIIGYDGVRNVRVREEDPEDPHSLQYYLRDSVVCLPIRDALMEAP